MEFLKYLPWIILAIVVIAIILSCLVVVPQAHAYIIERLGVYSATWEAGLKLKLPIIERIVRRISLKEQVSDFEPQPVITKDNVTMQIDSVVYWQIFDAKMFTYGVERPIAAIENLCATTLRNIIGELTLDETLTSRDIINSRITKILDDATDKWGIKINRVEVKNINPPRDIQAAMEKQMRAEREKREAILQAEGEKRSAILIAEGNKEALILNAEADKEAAIRRAEGEAQAILKVQEATARGIHMIAQAGATKEVLTIKGLEAFEKAANGQSTKIIIPSEIQSLAGLASSLTEISKEDSKPSEPAE